ncbi:MAG TPA: hypothetical protein EYQ43_01820 [Methyloprofundus sp.]|uniref:hypothetical protein n=1 Tax=Methyloprofundus sp. TaxID=2020875 RepID=UPI00179EEA28|nr:hypothetical protein [Methyloprofundus sp.]HIG64319.1 hypothetical protein [Methyloprofundus sp.]HIL78739.1 hypothetical protein [Methylococcales bacterium]
MLSIDSAASTSSTQPKLRPLRGIVPFKQSVWLVLLFIILSFIGYLSTVSLIKIDMDADTNSEIQVFWANELGSFSESQSRTDQVKAGRHSYHFWIDGFNQSTRFRIDPVNQQALIKLYSTQLYSLHYFPVDLNPVNDRSESNEIKIINKPDDSRPYIEFQSLGNDPQIEFRVIHIINPSFYLLLFALITITVFRKKALTQAILLILASVLLSYLFTFNDTTISLDTHLKNPETAKLFWRDKGQKISTTRAQKIELPSGANQTSVASADISNIDVFYLESGNNQALQNLDTLTIRAPGFKEQSYQQSEVMLNKQSNAVTLVPSVAVFLGIYLLLLYSVWYYKKKKPYTWNLFYENFIKSCFLFASALVFCLAWQADYNIHPDEGAHIESTKYYSQYWLPPTVGDPRATGAYQKPWATSRLDDLGISYFFAGKFSLLVQQLFADETFINRAFNALLFLLLFIMNWSNKRLLIFLTPLLCTPQTWYLYAYANRGGFVLFISLLLAWQLANKQSSLNRFLNTDRALARWQDAVFPGVLLGILSIEQTNYLLFILFVFSLLLWELLFFVKQKKTFIYKCLFFSLIGASIFFARHGIDHAINGSNKLEQRIAYAEQHAAPDFKPSIAETEQSYPGLRLKAKGVSLAEIFQPEWQWHKMTFKSFTGLYGYYAQYSPKWYYTYIMLIYGIVILLVLRHAIFKANWRYKLFTAVTITAIAGGLLMSILFSWLYDFQPQGRYIFPIIPILLVFFWKMLPLWNRMEKAVLISSVITLMVLSFYSFRVVALNYLFS